MHKNKSNMEHKSVTRFLLSDIFMSLNNVFNSGINSFLKQLFSLHIFSFPIIGHSLPNKTISGTIIMRRNENIKGKENSKEALLVSAAIM